MDQPEIMTVKSAIQKMSYELRKLAQKLEGPAELIGNITSLVQLGIYDL